MSLNAQRLRGQQSEYKLKQIQLICEKGGRNTCDGQLQCRRHPEHPKHLQHPQNLTQLPTSAVPNDVEKLNNVEK